MNKAINILKIVNTIEYLNICENKSFNFSTKNKKNILPLINKFILNQISFSIITFAETKNILRYKLNDDILLKIIGSSSNYVFELVKNKSDEFVRDCIRKNPSDLLQRNKKYNNLKFLKPIIDNNDDYFIEKCLNIFDDEIFLYIIKNKQYIFYDTIHRYKYVKNDELKKLIFNINPNTIKYMSYNNKNKEISIKAFNFDIDNFKYIPDEYKNDDMILKAIDYDINNIMYVKNQSEKIQEIVLNKNFKLIKYFINPSKKIINTILLMVNKDNKKYILKLYYKNIHNLDITKLLLNVDELYINHIYINDSTIQVLIDNPELLRKIKYINYELIKKYIIKYNLLSNYLNEDLRKQLKQSFGTKVSIYLPNNKIKPVL